MLMKNLALGNVKKSSLRKTWEFEATFVSLGCGSERFAIVNLAKGLGEFGMQMSFVMTWGFLKQVPCMGE